MTRSLKRKPSTVPLSDGWLTLPSVRAVTSSLTATTWALYIRRSYVESTAAEVSDETQLETAKRLVPDGAPVVVIRDSGGHNSGRNDRRDGYQRMMAMLAAGQLAGIVAYDPWRLARNTRLTLNLLYEVTRQGVDIRFVTMPQSLRGATGHFALTVYAAAGQLQADADS